jgi:hypothetical protein
VALPVSMATPTDVQAAGESIWRLLEDQGAEATAGLIREHLGPDMVEAIPVLSRAPRARLRITGPLGRLQASINPARSGVF